MDLFLARVKKIFLIFDLTLGNGLKIFKIPFINPYQNISMIFLKAIRKIVTSQQQNLRVLSGHCELKKPIIDQG
jgi:hypothetical protein